MTTSEMHDFKNVMMGITEIYGVEFIGAAFEIYLNAVVHIDIDTIREAVNEHVKKIPEGRFYPKPCEIIAFHDAKIKKILDDEMKTYNLQREKFLEFDNFIRFEISSLSLDAMLKRKNITCTNNPSTLAYVEKLGGWEKVLEMFEKEEAIKFILHEGFREFELSRRRLANHPEIPVSSNLHLVKN
jgi:hypothetical protein